ncbi:MAG: DUF1330 domain-containing protein, partial [Pseudolabrys sp.]
AAGCYNPRQSLRAQLSANGFTKSNRWFGCGWTGETMRIQHTIALAVAVGLGLGIIATRGLAAQAKRTFYVVVEVDEITDADGYKAMTKIGPTNIVEVKHADGRYLARSDSPAALDGTPPKRFVMIAFDSMEKANGFYQNTKEMTAMRIKATKSRAFIVEGL